MSIADLRRCALAYGWKLVPGGWQERLAEHIHHNKILHVFRHAQVKRDAAGKPYALYFADLTHARSAKDDMHHVDKVFGLHMALLCGAKHKIPSYEGISSQRETPAMAADDCLRSPRAAGQVAVIPVNDSRRQLTSIDDNEIARATSRLMGWRRSVFNSAPAQKQEDTDAQD